MEATVRSAKLCGRVTPRERKMVELAASADGATVSRFVAEASVRAARAKLFAGHMRAQLEARSEGRVT